MKASHVVYLALVVVIIVVVFYMVQGSGDATAYNREILKEREEKNRFMRSSPESPFASSTETFRELNYFPPDINFKIIANLYPIEGKKMVVLQTNDGKEQRYLEYAFAEFDMGNVKNRLLILESMEMGPYRGKLFLAFGDATSANETYGGGRYLDLAKTPGSTTITLDFNKAYNPYCAYNNTYSCPLPPAENLLKIPIRAGEKNYGQ